MAMTLSKREKRLLMAAGFVLAAFLFYRFVLTPQLNDYKAVQSRVKTQEETLNMVKNAASDYEKEIEALAEEEELFTYYKQFDPGNQGTALVWLNSLAQEHGLNLSLYKPSAEKDNTKQNPDSLKRLEALIENQNGLQLGKQQEKTERTERTQSAEVGEEQDNLLPFQDLGIVVTGSYRNIIKFLAELEDAKYFTLVNVDSITIASELVESNQEINLDSLGQPVNEAPPPPNLLVDPVKVSFKIKIYNMREQTTTVSLPVKIVSRINDLVSATVSTASLREKSSGRVASYSVEVKELAEAYSIQFSGDFLRAFNSTDFNRVLEIKTPLGTYRLSPGTLNLDSLAREMQTETDKLKVNFCFDSLKKEITSNIKQAAGDLEARLAVEPVGLKIIVTDNNFSRPVDYLEKMVFISQSFDLGFTAFERTLGIHSDFEDNHIVTLSIDFEEEAGEIRAVFDGWRSGIYGVLELSELK